MVSKRRIARLNKQELQQLTSIFNKLCKLEEHFQDNDLQLQIEGNGTVRDNINCAIASLEVILQEY